MSAAILVFGAALLIAVLTSSIASRTALSASAVFLAVGMLFGPLGLDVVVVEAHRVEVLAEIALFAILFTDGQHAPWRVVRTSWAPPVLTLVVAMPLTFALVAGLAYWVVGLSWAAALVVGAVLAPTDPVFASALVGREDVPRRVRNLLNLESGLNDGLTLPVVLVLVGFAGGDPGRWSTEPGVLLAEVAIGAVLGIVLPLLVWLVLRLPGVGSVTALRPLGPVAVAVLLFGACSALSANQFLAAFLAGVVMATVAPEASASFRGTGELVTELVKGGALLAFASLLDAAALQSAGWTGLLLALGVLLVARPLPMMAVLARSSLSRRETLSVAWFGPRGFASVAYAVIVAVSDMPEGDRVLALVALTVLVSVLAHSSTDVAVARWLSADRHGPRGSSADRSSEP